ncbi:MAG: hypothetical protein JST04_16490 [Bdellovibrionales bacterium]|nr:hypothetical protein [Bdellovibrionales bacterium]
MKMLRLKKMSLVLWVLAFLVLDLPAQASNVLRNKIVFKLKIESLKSPSRVLGRLKGKFRYFSRGGCELFIHDEKLGCAATTLGTMSGSGTNNTLDITKTDYIRILELLGMDAATVRTEEEKAGETVTVINSRPHQHDSSRVFSVDSSTIYILEIHCGEPKDS